MLNALASALETTRQTFDEGGREAEVCTYIFELLERLRGGFECISLGEVVTHFKWHDNKEAAKSIQATLDYLSFCSQPILERKFVLIPDSDDDLLGGDEIFISNSEIRTAMERGFLVHPDLEGEEIRDFLDRIQVRYCKSVFIENLISEVGDKE